MGLWSISNSHFKYCALMLLWLHCIEEKDCIGLFHMTNHCKCYKKLELKLWLVLFTLTYFFLYIQYIHSPLLLKNKKLLWSLFSSENYTTIVLQQLIFVLDLQETTPNNWRCRIQTKKIQVAECELFVFRRQGFVSGENLFQN